MAKLLVSICSKIDGLDAMKINFIHEKAEYSLDCAYTKYAPSFYGKQLSNDEIDHLIDFLLKSREGSQ